MTSYATNPHKNSDTDRNIAQIVELVEKYCTCARKVRRPLSQACSILKKKRLPTDELCLSLLHAIEEMSPSLALLCSAFQEDSQLPDTFISIHIPTFILVRDIQIQSEHVRVTVRRCYECLLTSALEKVVELQTNLTGLLTSFRMLLNKGFQFFKRRFSEVLDLSRESFPKQSPKGNSLKQSASSSVMHESFGDISLSPLVQGYAPSAQQNESVPLPHPIIATYPTLIQQRYTQLVKIEEKKVQFSDPRTYPTQIEEEEREIRKEIQRLESELVIAEQRSLKCEM